MRAPENLSDRCTAFRSRSKITTIPSTCGRPREPPRPICQRQTAAGCHHGGEACVAAGAIILGKTNLDEYAPAGIARSALGGQTCNPYDTKRIPGGSSAGSGAAVAANLAICALGTDTSGSVRIPASVNTLVGMVATQGLISRAGIVPLSFSRDRGGPLCRTVADTAIVSKSIDRRSTRAIMLPQWRYGKKPVAYRNYRQQEIPRR